MYSALNVDDDKTACLICSDKVMVTFLVNKCMVLQPSHLAKKATIIVPTIENFTDISNKHVEDNIIVQHHLRLVE